MKLGRRILVTNAALMLGLVVLGGVSLYGVLVMRHDMRIAYEEYREVEVVADIEGHVARVLAEASQAPADLGRIRHEIGGAVEKIEKLEAMQDEEGLASHEDAEHAEREHASIEVLGDRLRAMRLELLDADDTWGPQESYELAQVALEVLPELNAMTRVTHKAIREARSRANERIQTTALLLGVSAGVIVAASMLVSRSGYRGVMIPLGRLREGVARIVGGRFDEPIPADRVDEFNDLAREFNAMADRLGDYRDRMEEKVALKGKELVRSERLASVGFLAAGVAHEINNPLGIISTYAEISLNELASQPASPMVSDLRHTLTIVHEEAHRCKAITQKLLSLSRGGSDQRSEVSMCRVACEIVETLRGLKRYDDRRIELLAPEHDALTVSANAVEMKQVMLNLVMNALDATSAGVGVVRITGRRIAGDVVMSVEDNGRGMDAATLDRVFEPFFTTREQAGGGVGLGLSICHAIVQSHDGRIRADSDGPGRGSRFTVELPAIVGEVAHGIA